MNSSLRGPFLTALLLCVSFQLPIVAQSLDNSTVFGTVTDGIGAPLIGATVTLVPKGPGTLRSALTGTEGTFMFNDMSPGLYRITVSAGGFVPAETDEVSVPAATRLRLRTILRMSDSAPLERVRADADLSAVETSGTAVVSSLFVDEGVFPPGLSRSPLDLIWLLGGVSEEALSVRGLAEDTEANHRTTPVEQGFGAISGGGSYSNNITIDGLDNNDDRTARERFAPPLDAVSEVQLVRNQFSAEYGRAAGSRLNLITRSGSDGFRGGLSALFRHEGLNANSWNNNRRGMARMRLREGTSGGYFGGPLKASAHGASFFFVSAESGRSAHGTLVDTFVPTLQNSRHPIREGTGDRVFCDSDDAADCEGPDPSAAFMRQLLMPVPTPGTSVSAFARADHRDDSGGSFNLSLQLGRSASGPSSARLTRTPEAFQRRRHETGAVSLSASKRLTNDLLGSFRIQLSEQAPGFRTARPGAPVVLIGYRNPLTGSRQTLVAGNSTSGTLQDFSEGRLERRLQASAAFTAAKGSGTLRFGTELSLIDSRAKSLSDASGTFSFPTILDFGRNVLSRFRQSFGTSADSRNTYAGFFVNRDISPFPNLSVTAGLRFETETAIRDWNNFGPRFGIAWDPSSNGRGAVRLGFGTFFNRVLLRTVGDFTRSQAEGFAEFDSNDIGTSASDVRRIRLLAAVAQRFPIVFASAADLRALIASTDCGTGPQRETCPAGLGFSRPGSATLPSRTIARGIQIPQSHQANIGYERRFGRGFVMEANLTWNKTVRLWRERAANLPVLPAGRANWSEHLLLNPFVFRNSNGSQRTYVFYMGPTSGAGVSAQPYGTGSCPVAAETVCWVNLNSSGSSVSRPSTAGPDSSNSVGSPIGIAFAALDRLRPDPASGTGQTVVSAGASLYRGLVIEFRKAVRDRLLGLRLSLRAAYTLSKLEDDGLNNTSNAEVDGDFRREWSRSLSDRLHRLSVHARIETPAALGRVELTPIIRYGSSAPIAIGTGVDRNLDGSSNDRPDFSGSLRDLRWRRHPSASPDALLSLFGLAPIGSSGGSLPRNAGTGPSFTVFDLAVFRRFTLGRGVKISPRLEISNILNAVNFSYGAEYTDLPALGPNPTAAQLETRRSFLVPRRTMSPREMTMGLRIEF